MLMLMFSAVASAIRNFKMSLYLELSTRLQGRWIALTVLELVSIQELVTYNYCHYAGEGKKCFRNISMRTCQTLIVLSLSCCLLVISDLFTAKYKKQQSPSSGLHSHEAPGRSEAGVAVIEVQQNNFFAQQQEGGVNCCTGKDHVSLSTGFLTLIMIILLAGTITCLVEDVKEEEPVWSWQLSLLGIFIAFIVASIWIVRERELRDFTIETIRNLY